MCCASSSRSSAPSTPGTQKCWNSKRRSSRPHLSTNEKPFIGNAPRTRRLLPSRRTRGSRTVPDRGDDLTPCRRAAARSAAGTGSAPTYSASTASTSPATCCAGCPTHQARSPDSSHPLHSRLAASQDSRRSAEPQVLKWHWIQARGYRTQSLSFSSACLVNGTAVTRSYWSRSAVLSWTDSVRLPAAKTTVSCWSTS